ncbi:MAG: formylglycine-generating enzyme family protein [Chitinophagaceae bacterium]|nr:formylglycine-generating enzyme family protein [Chitinophagaceae bacterium]
MMAFVSTLAQKTEFRPYVQTIPGTTLTFKMSAIPEGEFVMGSTAREKERKQDEGPTRKVHIAAFWMGSYEVTHDEFLIFFNDEKTSRNSDVDAVTRPTPQYIDLSWGMGKQGGFPTNSMSQQTALMYCRWLYKKTGIFYRLPTEAEWEYACRAGSTTMYSFGNDPALLPQYAWFAANSNNKYQKVGQKKPNAWGLYDMLGNVAEWTLDQYDAAYFTKIADGSTNPMIPPGTRYPKAVRGGGYLDRADAMRSASRFKSDPSWNKRDPQIPKSKWWLTDAAAVGFRIVRPFKQPSTTEIDQFYSKYLGN